MKMLRGALELLVGALFLFAAPALAHTSATSFLSLHVLDEHRLVATFDLDLKDLESLLTLDANDDGVITWGEVRQASNAIESLALGRTQIRAGNALCVADGRDDIAIAEHGDGPYARLAITLACPQATRSLAVDYSGWFSVDAGHRALYEFVDRQDAREQSILTASRPLWRTSESMWARAKRFVDEGARHLLTGYDHLAFLSVLLLALARRREGVAVAGAWPLARRALAVITSFTLAHSCTLALAANGWLTLPSRPVEALIAASVVIAALLNLSREPAKHGWKLAFGFGLVHGLGFAGALAETTSEHIDLLALGAFNAGIELAQIACAAAVIPLIWALFRHTPSQRVVVPLASLAVAAVAMEWVVARIL
jgi:hypothetical protein